MSISLDPERDMLARSLKESKKRVVRVSDDPHIRLLTETTYIQPIRDESD
jgi:hypothetical protein